MLAIGRIVIRRPCRPTHCHYWLASCLVIAASGNQADAFTPALKAHASCAQGQ